MERRSGFHNIWRGERGVRQGRERLVGLTNDLRLGAHKALLPMSSSDRQALIVDTVSYEISKSAEYFHEKDPIHNGGVWETESFWKDMRSYVRRTVERASRRSEVAFNPDGSRNTLSEAKKIFADAYTAKGLRPVNREYLMRAMARLSPKEHYDLRREDHRAHVADRIDQTLDDVGLLTLRRIVMDELGIQEDQLKAIPTDSAEATNYVYGRLEEIVESDDVFRTEEKVLENRSLQIVPRGPFDREEHHERLVFVQLAFLGANSTWKTGKIYQDVWNAEKKQTLKENFRSLPDYIHHMFEKYTRAGMDPSDAVLRIAYELEKDLDVLRQTKGMTLTAADFPDLPQPPQEEVIFDKKPRWKLPNKLPPRGAISAAALAAGLFSSSVDQPLVPVQPEPIRQTGGEQSSGSIAATNAERDIPGNTLSSVLARSLSRTDRSGNIEDSAAEERDSYPGNLAEYESRESGIAVNSAIGLLENFFLRLDDRPRFRDEFNKLNLDIGTHNAEQRAHALALQTGLWVPGEGSIRVLPGDSITFTPGEGLYLTHISGEKLLLVDGTGQIHMYRGTLIPDRQ